MVCLRVVVAAAVRTGCVCVRRSVQQPTRMMMAQAPSPPCRATSTTTTTTSHRGVSALALLLGAAGGGGVAGLLLSGGGGYGGGGGVVVAAQDLPKSSIASLVAEADKLYDQMKYDEIYTLLSPYKDAGSDEVLWRLGRATYEKGKAAGSEEARQRLFREALVHVEAAHTLNTENFAVHKWLSILIDFVAAAEGTKERLMKAYVTKEHMIKACELNPSDATSRYLLGYWFFSFASVPWYQRKVASVIFTTPPAGTFQEALQNFLHAETLEPNFYSKNLLMIGKCYLMMGQKVEAKEYLERTTQLTPRTQDDHEAVEEAQALLRGL